MKGKNENNKHKPTKHYDALIWIVIIAVVIIASIIAGRIVYNIIIDPSTSVSNHADAWFSFFGAYLGGVITLVGVLITVAFTRIDTKRQIDAQKKESEDQFKEDRENLQIQFEEQREITSEQIAAASKETTRQIKEQRDEQREDQKHSIRPYLVTDIFYVDKEDYSDDFDRVFDIGDDHVYKMRFKYNSVDKGLYGAVDRCNLRYVIRNVGLGSAVEMTVSVSDYTFNYAIAKGQTATFFLMQKRKKEDKPVIIFYFDYWDAAHIGHYQKTDVIHLDYQNNSGDAVEWHEFGKQEEKGSSTSPVWQNRCQ